MIYLKQYDIEHDEVIQAPISPETAFLAKTLGCVEISSPDPFAGIPIRSRLRSQRDWAWNGSEFVAPS